MAITAAVIFTLIALPACGPRIGNQNLEVVNRQRAALDRLGKGLSPKEVEAILGQPTRVENFKIPLVTHKPVLDGVRFFYDQDGHTIELHFVDGKLISDAPLLGAEQPERETK